MLRLHRPVVRPDRSRAGSVALLLAGAIAASLAGCSAGEHLGASPPTATTAPTTTAPTTTRVGTTSTTHPATLHVAVVGPALPEPISREVALSVGGRIEVLGGRTAAKVSTDEVVDWQPDGSATVVGHLARRVHDAAGVAMGRNAVVFGGGDGGSVADVQSFDGTSGTRIGALATGRSDLSTVDLDGTAYVIGGFDDVNGVTDVQATTDGVTFHRVATLPGTLRYGAAVAVGSKALVFGGEDGGRSSDAVLQLDPATRTVSEVAKLPVRLSHAVAFVLDGAVYVAGGETDGVRTDVIYRYDPAQRSFTVVGHLPGPRSDASAVVRDGTAYIIGGEGPETLGDVVSLTWS